MLKIGSIDVYGFEPAIRGARNPMNSWGKSDSNFDYPDCFSCPNVEEGKETSCELLHCIVLGENDLKLMKSLSKAGNDHAKFLRMIEVWVDITAPLYWWKEADTYKVGTTENSCSTMHKIHAKEFERDDFSHEKLLDDIDEKVVKKFKHVRGYVNTPLDDLDYDIEKLNMYREMFLETNDKVWWEQIIQRLPSSYNQLRTVHLNYQVLKSMYFARRDHKLSEWHTLCDWMLTLPYFKEICVDPCDKNV